MPFHYARISSVRRLISTVAETKGLLRFFMQGGFLAPLAILFQFKLRLDQLLVACRLVVNMLTHRALQLDEIILRHTCLLLNR